MLPIMFFGSLHLFKFTITLEDSVYTLPYGGNIRHDVGLQQDEITLREKVSLTIPGSAFPALLQPFLQLLSA
jgi:hypothetical protein